MIWASESEKKNAEIRLYYIMYGATYGEIIINWSNLLRREQMWNTPPEFRILSWEYFSSFLVWAFLLENIKCTLSSAASRMKEWVN